MKIRGNKTLMPPTSKKIPMMPSSTAAALLVVVTMATLQKLPSSEGFVIRPSTIFHKTKRIPGPVSQWYKSSEENYEGEDIGTNTTEEEPFIPSVPTSNDEILEPTEASASAITTYAPQDIWKTEAPTFIQGGSIRTWTFDTPLIDMVQVHLKTDGRPMNTNLELWQGPDNTPQKIAIYVEDGELRPVVCFLNTPFLQNSVSIRNTAQLEYPLQAIMEPSKLPSTKNDPKLATKMNRLTSTSPKVIQGGAVLTMPVPPHVKSVQIMLQTPEGRPLDGRIELLNGPNNVKQVMETFSEDGMLRPFYSILQTPTDGGGGNVLRIVNTASIELPMTALVEPWDVEGDDDEGDVGQKMQEDLRLENHLQDETPLLELGGSREWGPGFQDESNGRGSK